MKKTRVGLMLAASIFVMAVVPLLAAFYLLENALRTSLDLGFNPQIVRVLDESAANLRELARLDSARADEYRMQFDEIQELRQVYAESDLVKRNVTGTLKQYFGLGLGVVMLLSIALASLLSRRIARSHAQNVAELTRQRDRVRYLEEMSSWQELAKMLAHEIKNPLTPIEVLVTSLSKAYLGKSQQEFLAHLESTQSMIGEELEHLKATVNRFSEFARLPQVQLAEVDLVDVVRRQLNALPDLAERAGFEFRASPESIRARIDVTLFRQVLANLVRNGIEANPGRRVKFSVTLDGEAPTTTIRVANDGTPVSPEIAARIFDPYISTKSGADNMGLGLAIVKKIVLEHGGDIRHEDRDGHPEFVITLPGIAA